jgi:hypothetical protein
MLETQQTQRGAPHRIAPPRAAPQRNATSSWKRAQRIAAPLAASRRLAAPRTAPRHAAPRHLASQRNATFSCGFIATHLIASLRNAAPRGATRRDSTQRFHAVPAAARHRASRRVATQRHSSQRNATSFLEELQMLFETSEETLHLRAFLAVQPPGARLSYSEIEAATGIRMDDSGRGKLRRAAVREGLPYDCLIGEGIELAGPGNGIHIIGGRLERIRHAITRTEKTHANIQARFLDQMSTEDQKRCVYVGVIFSAMHAAAERVKGLHTKVAPRKLGNT